MDPALEITAKIATPILTFALGRAWPRVVAEVKYRRTKRFWRPIARSNPMVVVGTHHLSSWEATRLMSVAEAKALHELHEHFRSLYLPDFEVSFGNELPSGQSFDRTLLCLGGPDTSVISARAWRSLPTSFSWGSPELHEVSIHDGTTGRHYAPVGFGTHDVTRDYALLVRAPNPFAPIDSESSAFLFAGCLGYGTWAAVRYSIGAAFLSHPLVRAGDPIECLLSVEVVADAPQRVELLEARPLSFATEPSGSR